MGNRPNMSSGSAVSLGLHQRGIAFCFLLSFLSLQSQVIGLIGQDGISPARQHLQLLQSGKLVPAWTGTFTSVFAVHLSDDALWYGVLLGSVSSAMAVVGCNSRIPLLLSVSMFISIANAAGDFLAYPWDGLLIEAGVMALLLPAPSFGVLATQRQAHWLARLANQFLGFRLVFSMGLHKCLFPSDMPPNGWLAGTYLDNFYVWQPMPTPAGLLAHRLGEAWPVFNTCSIALVFAAQVILPMFDACGL